MKKVIWILAIIALIIVGYTVAGPYITVHQLKGGIKQQDSEKLSENIDFPSLRQNLKEQLNSYMMRNTATELKDNPFRLLAVGLASKLVDGMVESFVTPAGPANLMEGKKPKQGEISETASTDTNLKREPFKKARYIFDSMSKFSVWVPNEKGEEVRFVLTRNALDWKLSNIVIPLEIEP